MDTETQTLEAPDQESGSAPSGRTRVQRRTLKRIGIGIAVVFVAGGIVAGIDALVADTTHMTTIFEQRFTRIDLHIASGDVRIVGTDDDEVTIEAAARGGLRKPDHSERVDGDTLVVRSGCDLGPLTMSCSIKYVIRVPRDVAVTARGDGTDFVFEAVHGDLDIGVNGGNVRAEFDEAPEHVKARSDGGSIVLLVPDDGESYDVDADTDGGSTHVDIRTDPGSRHVIDAHSDGGSVRLGYLGS
jgi:Toastrack DUF4097